jgi:hypothetical protein
MKFFIPVLTLNDFPVLAHEVTFNVIGRLELDVWMDLTALAVILLFA